MTTWTEIGLYLVAYMAIMALFAALCEGIARGSERRR